MYQTIETVSAQAWPSIEESYVGPFFLRCAGGFTKRANSALLLPDDDGFEFSESSFEQFVAPVERWYGERRLPAIFRMTEFSPCSVDSVLEERGYNVVEPTLVMKRSTRNWTDSSAQAVGAISGTGRLPSSVSVELLDGEAWLEVEAAMTGRSGEELDMMRHVMKRNQRCNDHFIVMNSTTPVACGLGVNTGQEYAIFCLYTAQAYRRSGYGRLLLSSMIDRASLSGAETVWLQVVKSNVGAQKLYRHTGFSELYTYWYRVQSES